MGRPRTALVWPPVRLSFDGRRLLPAAGLLALALFSAACDPADTTPGTAAPPPASLSATPSAPDAPAPAAPVESPSGSSGASPGGSPTPAAPAATGAPARTTAPTVQTAKAAAPAPVRTTAAAARTTAAPKPAPTTAAAHHCAHHTTGLCGWDVGASPASGGETAECNDSTASFSATFSGTCSHHGGVRYWFK